MKMLLQTIQFLLVNSMIGMVLDTLQVGYMLIPFKHPMDAIVLFHLTYIYFLFIKILFLLLLVILLCGTATLIHLLVFILTLSQQLMDAIV